jgi:hypothetical protein
VQALTPLPQMSAADWAKLAAPLRAQIPARLVPPEATEAPTVNTSIPGGKALLNLTRSGGALCAHLVNYDFRYNEKFELQSIEPIPAVTLQAPGIKRATLLAPGAEPRPLLVKDGKVQVPPLRIYGVVVMR